MRCIEMAAMEAKYYPKDGLTLTWDVLKCKDLYTIDSSWLD